MKKKLVFPLTLFILYTSVSNAQYLQPAPGEVFSTKIVINSSPFRHPFAMVMGPNDSLWVTEKRGYVIRVNSQNGNKTQLLDIHTLVKFTTSGSGSSMGISQDGMFGIALHPDLGKGKGTDYVYVAYCYDSSENRRTKIVQYTYAKSATTGLDTLKNAKALLTGI